MYRRSCGHTVFHNVSIVKKQSGGNDPVKPDPRKMLCFLRNYKLRYNVCESLVILHLSVYEEWPTQEFPLYLYILKNNKGHNQINTDQRKKMLSLCRTTH